jgi:hypothetical protein
LAYPIRDGIPIMLAEQARDLNATGTTNSMKTDVDDASFQGK